MKTYEAQNKAHELDEDQRMLVFHIFTLCEKYVELEKKLNLSNYISGIISGFSLGQVAARCETYYTDTSVQQIADYILANINCSKEVQ